MLRVSQGSCSKTSRSGIAFIVLQHLCVSHATQKETLLPQRQLLSWSIKPVGQLWVYVWSKSSCNGNPRDCPISPGPLSGTKWMCQQWSGGKQPIVRSPWEDFLRWGSQFIRSDQCQTWGRVLEPVFCKKLHYHLVGEPWQSTNHTFSKQRWTVNAMVRWSQPPGYDFKAFMPRLHKQLRVEMRYQSKLTWPQDCAPQLSL